MTTLRTTNVGDFDPFSHPTGRPDDTWSDGDDATFVSTNPDDDNGVAGDLETLSGSFTALTIHARLSATLDPDDPGSGVVGGSPFILHFNGSAYDFVLQVSGDTTNPQSGPNTWAIPPDGVVRPYAFTATADDFTYAGRTVAEVAAFLAGGDCILQWQNQSDPTHTPSPTVNVHEASVDVVTGVETPCDTWVDLDLSTAVMLNDSGVDFYIPGLTLDSAKKYLIEFTWGIAGGGRGVWLTSMQDASTFGSFANLADDGDNGDDLFTATIGPGIEGWDDPSTGVAAGYDGIWFEVGGFDSLTALRIRKVCLVDLPCDTDVDLDLSTVVFTGLGAGGPFGQYGDGVIYSANFPGFPDFYVPGIDLDPTKRYLVEVTYDPSSVHDSGGRGFSLTGVIPGQEDDPNTVPGFPIGDLYDGSGNTLDTVTVTIGPGINGWDDATYGVAAGYSGLWFETDRDGAVSGIRIRKVCDPSLDPTPPTPGGSFGSPGGAPDPDGDGPTAPLGDSAAPAGATFGGFLNPGNRRGAPTEVDVVVNGHWLSLECQWGDLRYSTTWPGGSGNASWSATSIPARLTRPDLSVTLMFAGQPVWAGVLSEPGDGEMDAVGLFTLGDNFTALDSDGDATTVIDDAIDAAITRGLRWKRRDSISGDALDLDVSTGPATLRGLLDAYCDAEAKRWGVDPYGYVYVAADPTTPDYYVQDFGPLAPSTDDLATALVGRYYDGSDYLTTIVTSPSVAWLGYHEQTIDLTGRGTITEARAKHILGNLLARGLSLPTWATPLAATYGELLTAGQVPAALETVRAGEMVRSMGQLDDTQSAGGQTWVDVVIGSAELYEGALSLTPISAPARTFADVLARAARAS